MMEVIIMKEDRTVEISLDEYEALILDAHTLNLLFTVIYQGARLGWNGIVLSFNDSEIDMILKLVSPDSYETKLKQLQKEKESEGDDE